MPVGKGSLLRAASASAADKKQPVRTAATAPEREQSMSCKMRIAVVSVEQLLEIPEKWRSAAYVIPNVSQLAESISRCGILEPIPVVQTGKDRYQLTGGSRRMQAVRMLGISEVPVVILPGSSSEDAEKIYRELKPFTDAAQDAMHNAKFRTASLFGSQRIPEYLL